MMKISKDKLFDQYFIDELRQGNREAFTLLFNTWYKDLIFYAATIIPDRMQCEDIVQTIFTEIWDERKSLSITTSLKGYLLRMVRNRCLDEIKHKEVIRNFEEKQKIALAEEIYIDDYILYSDLADSIKKGLQLLPPVVREAFELNRFAGLTYSEIAVKQQISLRSVEVRIGKALHFLKEYLKEYLIVFLCMLKLVSFLW